jgi:tetratricopeptide (TPR) repeat protein
MVGEATAPPPTGAATGPQGEPAAPPPAQAPRQFVICRWLVRAARACRGFLSLRRLVFLVLALVALGVGGKVLFDQGWAWYHFRAGKVELERHHNLRALEHLEACLQTWPRDPDALFLTARACGRLGDFDRAEAYLKQCEGTHRLAEDVGLERVLLRAARGDVDGVSGYCRALIDKGHPAASLLFEAMISGYLRVYRFADAGRYLEQWLKKQPDNPQALLLQGRLFEQLNNHAEAAAAFQRVLDLDPEQNEARLLLAGILLDLRKGQEALPHLQRLRDELPGHRLIQVLLARCLDHVGRRSEAQTVLDDLLSGQQTYAPALAERGKLAVREGDLELAESLLREACLREPGDYSAHYQLYLCLTLRDKKSEAKEVLQRMNEINENQAKIREITGGKMQRAPRNPEVHYELGATLLRAGSVEEGLQWLQSALKLDPKHGPTHQVLANHYLQLGQFGRAARHRELAGIPAKGTPP